MPCPTPEFILALEQRRLLAMQTSDSATLRELLADDVLYVHSTAASDTKASYLAKIENGSLRFLELAFDHMQAQVHAHFALVTGRMRASALKSGQPFAVRSVFMTVWAPQSDAPDAPWCLRAHQGTPTP